MRILALLLLGCAAGVTAYAAPTPELPAAERDAIDATPVVPPGLNRGYRLQTEPARRITATYAYRVDAPRLAAEEWIVLLAVPPTLPGQAVLSARANPPGEVIAEVGPLGRKLFRVRVVADRPTLQRSVVVEFITRVTLRARKLVPRTRGQPARRVRPLAPGQRDAALRPTPFYDYASDRFLAWKSERGLTRKSREGEVDFARRVFLEIVRGFAYDYRAKMDRSASHVGVAGRSDCGGLANLFVATLRSEGVPARTLAGRWARSEEPGREVNGVRYQQQHAKAEFYAQGVGWVPADLSSSILHDKTPDRLRYFGADRGDFLAMHVDAHFEYDSVHFGVKSRAFLQRAVYWVSGEGSLEGVRTDQSWTVE